jgi:hypothetical protein
MGFDIIVIKPRRVLASLTEWTADDVADPLGTPAEMREQCLMAFPEMCWSTERFGLYYPQKDDYAVEFSIPSDEQPGSLHLTLRFGPSWNDERRDSFHIQMARLCDAPHWQAFAISDNSALLPIDGEAKGDKNAP